MKDHPSQSHNNVASSRKAPQAPPSDGTNYNLQCDSSFSDDNDWDTGKLVIDLDVDTSKSPQKSVSVTPKKSAVVALTRSPIKTSGGVGHSMEHHAVVDKGLKMKIKRKNAGAKCDTKGHEIVRSEQRGLTESIQQQNPTVHLEKMKTTSSCDSAKDKGPKNRANQKDKKAMKDRNIKQSVESGLANGSVFPALSGAGPSHSNNVSVTTDVNHTVTDPDSQLKGGANAPDPYEFNAKVEDRVGVPRMKKIKVEKTESPCPIGMKDVGVETCSQGAMTDPDCLGPCEPGTSVTLEGIVWQENENGMLVVNVTWRGKTFVGTLLDATKHDWAPPRLGCDSPTNELETRTPKGRGKRGRGGNQVPLNDVSNCNTDRRLRKGRRRNSGANTAAATFTAPPSPAKQEINNLKRKGRPSEPEQEASKKSRTCSNTRSTPTSAQDELIECPDPKCSKKYRHINGLRYHQSHAHQNTIDDNGDVIIKEEKMDISPSGKEECDNKKEDSVAKAKDLEKDSVKEKDKEKSKSEKSVKGKGKKSSKQDKESSKSSKSEENDSSSVSNSKPTGAQGKGASLTEVTKPPTTEVKKTTVPSTDCKTNSESNNKAVTDTKTVTDKTHTKTVTDKTHSDTKVVCNNSTSEIVKAVESITSQADILKSSVAPSVISSSSPGLTVSAKKPHITYQISGPAAIGCVGGITVVSGSGQTVGTNIGAIASKVGPLGVGSNITTVSVPVATVVTATTVDIPKADEKIKKPKPEKVEKVKTKGTSANRPIVPAPMTVAQGGITTVTTHTQLSPITTTTSTLKPIQPKPTIMGETTSINPALSSLKDKKPKKKKSKDKDVKELPKDLSNKPSVSSVLQVPSHAPVKDTLSKPESLSVIKSAPSTTLVTPPRVITEVAKADALREILPGRSLLAPVKERVEEPPLLVQHQLHPQSAANTKPPGSLSLKSPQPTVEESSEQEANTSDVHSPAYSDISDANDSAPTLESESDLDRNIKTEPQGQNDGANIDKTQEQNLSRGYGMYPYYSQPPYLVPAVQPSSNTKPGDNGPNAIKETAKKPETPNTEPKKGQTRKDMEPREINTGSPLTAVVKGSRSAAPSPQQSPADIQRMQATQAQIYQQYQYMYNLNAEQAYHMTMMASDPNYRAQCEKYMKDSHQHQRASVDKEGEKRGDKSRQVSETVSRPPSEPTNLHQPVREGSHKGAEGKPENKPPALISDRERLDRERAEKERQQVLQREREMEQNLKEKQNENHQILKENIELKAQMDNNRHRYDFNPRHPEDLYRYQVMQQQQQQQKMHRVEELKPLDARKHPEHSPKDVSSKEKPDLRQDVARTRSPSTGPTQGPKDLSSPKPAVEKARHEEKISTASPRSTPKPKDGANIPSSGAPHTGYPQYMQHATYYPAQVPYEAGHPMYRGVSPIIGFQGPAPAYNLHPSQVRYVSPNEPNVEKEKVAISPNTPVSEAQSKEPLQAHGPHYYGPGQPHKIHELKDVGKSGEHPSPGKPGVEPERQPSPFNKSSSEHSNSPPTQRHLHSHHHTHVVTPGYPSVIYDPYNDHARLGRQSGISGVEQIQAFIGQPGPHPAMPPHYVPK